jgi:hypothetical protein
MISNHSVLLSTLSQTDFPCHFLNLFLTFLLFIYLFYRKLYTTNETLNHNTLFVGGHRVLLRPTSWPRGRGVSPAGGRRQGHSPLWEPPRVGGPRKGNIPFKCELISINNILIYFLKVLN